MSIVPNKTCPKCGSGDYEFRSRKKLPPEAGEEGPIQIETKYRCKSCHHEWRVKITA